MKTESAKVAVSSSVFAKSYVQGDDPRVKAMWDEEFFGHELPPNYRISRVRTPEGQEKTKDAAGKHGMKVERAIWDEEFLGHLLPPNYIISRLRTPEGLEKRRDYDRLRELEDSITREPLSSFQTHKKFISEDTFEYLFDRTGDSYVLSDELSGACKDDWGMQRPAGSRLTKEVFEMAETFEERALRFGVEDWNLVGKKESQNESNESKRSARRGIFHSPSGSDTSSLISTLESSSFSCGSEGSSVAKTDYSSSSFSLSHVYASSRGAVPLSTVGVSEDGAASEGQFVELTISERRRPEVQDAKLKGDDLKNRSYLEFEFLDGKMIETRDLDVIEDIDNRKGRNADHKSLTLTTDEDSCSEDFAVNSPSMYQSATVQSPESEDFFDSSHESDWSGTHSASVLDKALRTARDAIPLDVDEDDRRNFTDGRAAEDWCSDTHFYDAGSYTAAINPASFSGSKVHIHFHPAGEGKVANGANLLRQFDSVPAGAKPCNERNARSPKKIQGPSRKTRSLGSVLSHHLGFTAVPTLRCKSQPSFGADHKGSPAKVSAACIEWLWPEKGSMKSVQSLRVLAERENAERDRIGVRSSVAVGNLEYTLKESRASGLGRPLKVVNRWAGADIPRALECPFSAHRDTTRESRDTILASWAAVSGVSAAGRAKRSSAASKGAMIASSLKQGVTTGGISPRKKSVSYGAHASSNSGTTLTKSVPKNLALELEVLCRPFGPVMKSVRFLPNPKRGLARAPLFSNLGPRLTSSSSASSTNLAPVLKCGRLQCVLTRDGLPSYSLIMDESEEILIAKILRLDVGLQEGISHLYTFHSYKGKGKGKAGWRHWGKKEKPCSDFAGNMTVTSTIRPVQGSDGMQNFVESEFVLFDAKVKEISISGPTSTSPYPRSSFSSWDTATPQRSPQGLLSTFSSPSSTHFSSSSPALTGVSSSAANRSGTTPSFSGPSRFVSLSVPTGVKLGGSMSLDKGISRFKQLERYLSLGSPLHQQLKIASVGLHENASDSETVDGYEVLTCPQSQSELGAVVVRGPLEKAHVKANPAGEKWGWGINFLRKSFDSGSTQEQEQGAAEDALSASDGVREKALTTYEGVICSTEGCNSMDGRCTICGGCSIDGQGQEELSITLILPTGEHGCSANGIDGPQPLIERWRSGGKCDCGSWDLGCGLTIVSSHNTHTSQGKRHSRDNTLRLYVQGKKQQTVGLALTPLREGCYKMEFQAHISPLHAFATAVAVLHSRDPISPEKKLGELKRRLTRIPVKVGPTTSRLFARSIDESPSYKSLSNYNKLVCPDPPPSPFGRA